MDKGDIIKLLDKPIPLTEQKWESDILPAVSVSCITYNHSAYIRDAIESFLMQKTTFPVEILIHDDASTDGTADIIREYEAKYPNIIKPIYQTENQYSRGIRISATFNYPRAKGKYIAICEGDDYWIDPYKLQKQVSFLEENREYGLVFTDADVFIEKTRRFIKHYDKTYKKKIPEGDVINTLLYKNPYKTCTSLFRSIFLKDFYNYIDRFSFKMGDAPLWLCIARKSKVKYLTDTTSVYRVHDRSVSQSDNIGEAIRFLRSGYKLSLSFSKYYDIPIDKNKLRKVYIRSSIFCCIRNNNLKYLSQYLKYPHIIFVQLLKEKVIKRILDSL